MTTGEIRVSYVHVWQPQAPLGGGEPKYSITMLIPKSDAQTINAVYAAIEAAKQQGVATTWKGKMPPNVKIPIYDGDGTRPNGEPFADECKGHMIITGSSKQQPFVVDANVQPVINQADFYSGCYARAALNFFAYDSNGNRGIGCGLNGVQKTRDGEPLAGRISAEEAFGGANAYGTYQNQTPVPQTPYQPAAYPQQQYQPQPQMPPTQPAPQYQQPAPQYQQQMAQYQQQPAPQYQTPVYQQQMGYGAIDPITGQPAIGGVMGIS